MSWLDLGEAVDIFTSGVGKVVDVAGKVADAKFSWQSRELDARLKTSQIMQTNQQIKLNNFMATNQVEIAKVNAQAQLKRAQEAANTGIYDLLQANMSTGLGNIQSTLNGQGGGNNLMLYLTLAGVAIAGFQLIKGR